MWEIEIVYGTFASLLPRSDESIFFVSQRALSLREEHFEWSTTRGLFYFLSYLFDLVHSNLSFLDVCLGLSANIFFEKVMF